MDSSPLRIAYRGLLDAALRVADAGARAAPPAGEWDADQLLAHVVAVDAGVLAAVSAVVAGGEARFDNRGSLDPEKLGRIARRLGDGAGLRDRVRVQGEVLAVLAEQLGEDELDQPVATFLQSGETVQLDGHLTLRELVAGLAADHLPRHATQLLAMLPEPEPVPAR